MIKNSIVGFARIGEQRELKFALEAFWSGKIDDDELRKRAKELRLKNLEYQRKAGIDLISVNDFSFYDGVLDMVVLLGAIPERFADISDELKLYFTMARGDEKRVAMEMTKWFNTNYHYIVPELSKSTHFTLNADKIIKEFNEAKELGINPKINLVGPLTFLSLSKSIDGSDVYEHLEAILKIYEQLLEQIALLDEKVFVQFDEPIIVTDLDKRQKNYLLKIYEKLSHVSPKLNLIVSSYFDYADKDTIEVLSSTKIWGIGLDFVHGRENLDNIKNIKDKYLMAGVIDGRNIWKNDINSTVQLLNKIALNVQKEHIIISTSCSLLHVPYSLKYEDRLDSEVKSWLSFVLEKLDEVSLTSRFFHSDTLLERDNAALEANAKANHSRKNSSKIYNSVLQERLKSFTNTQRATSFDERIKIQKDILKYPALATTTIGSFPQTDELRILRSSFKKGKISQDEYEDGIKKYIDECIRCQEEIGLDVLVHGEPERNDMVEYFGEQLNGYAFTQNGWVQSYGSRCVKPPLLFGDITRIKPMSVKWITYAQSRTPKIVKGMLTGPVTILNWSFVRDDLPKKDVAKQLALALNDEINDLQNADIKIIQVDEAAFKEGYPLRKSKKDEYEKWALEAFRLSVSSAKAQTQIHTHMCYSNFNDIIKTIEAMDADVISIETARAGNKILKIFKEVSYRQEIGPGIYDIHSPRIPSVEEMIDQIDALLKIFPKEQLWINPDCGLKTRKWNEVLPALENLVKAVKIVRGKKQP
ncbi:MAG: 5-methyltetrahydropteroyltriglutamate--homocysteine S-methyltransferase [Campylobacteraceae bacterium]|jgi:5-methyltetrahydropteroyltriglutamate--homocysteine methyltransferase|nr:5-methyltetrahydropteroyltriglutamate--homocysteine S-methyltransferase [Campylobacteraceae bacterium]